MGKSPVNVPTDGRVMSFNLGECHESGDILKVGKLKLCTSTIHRGERFRQRCRRQKRVGNCTPSQEKEATTSVGSGGNIDTWYDPSVGATTYSA